MARSLFRSNWPGLKTVLRASPGWAHYVFAFVFLLRLIALVRLTSSPLLLPDGSDMQFYDQWARQIVGGRLTDHHAFYGLPLYPYLLAFLYRFFGFSPFVPGLLQSALDAGTAVLIYLTTRKAVDLPVRSSKATTVTSAAAAFGWAFFLPAQAYSVILMPTAGAAFVFWLVVWRLIRNNSIPTPSGCLFLGALIGVTTMGVATILFLVPLVLGAIVLRRTKPGPRGGLRLRAMAAAALLGGLLAGTSPCWIHNYFVAGDRVILSAHNGINLWLGNNPEANGYPRFPGLRAAQAQMLRDSIDLAEAAAGRSLKRSEVSAYWAGKARDYIVAQPAAWLKLIGRKIGNFWNAFEFDDVGIIANLRAYGILFPGPGFGIIAILGIPGLFYSLRQSTSARWVTAAIVLQMVAVLPVFITERYRLPVVPGLLVLAATGLSELWNDCSLGRYRRALIYIVLLIAAAWLVTLPRPDPLLWATRAYNAGRGALSSGDFPRAEEQLQRAFALAPDNSEINLALGNLRLAQGNRVEARSFYSAVLRLDPRHKGALNNLGVMALEDGQFTEARGYFEKAIREEPSNAKTYYLLAKAELALGNTQAASNAIDRALTIEPDRPEYRQLKEEIVAHGK